jgi:hypothetical protein
MVSARFFAIEQAHGQTHGVRSLRIGQSEFRRRGRGCGSPTASTSAAASTPGGERLLIGVDESGIEKGAALFV